MHKNWVTNDFDILAISADGYAFGHKCGRTDIGYCGDRLDNHTLPMYRCQDGHHNILKNPYSNLSEILKGP